MGMQRSWVINLHLPFHTRERNWELVGYESDFDSNCQRASGLPYDRNTPQGGDMVHTVGD